MNGLVLTGGGARAAYQVGCLRAIYEITRLERNPFPIISGFSAGAINGTWLASHSESFDEVTQHMWDQWAMITMDQVFKTSSVSFLRIGLRWIKDRLTGGMQKRHQISYLLDTKPLRRFLNKHIDFETLNANLANRTVHGLALLTANYRTGNSTAFFAGDDQIKAWESLNRVSTRTQINADHIMASSAIPVFFPPIKIGDSYFGDGMVRLNSPLSTAIHMGAERILVIGVRGAHQNAEATPESKDAVTLGEIAGTILNGLFFDSVDVDIARLQKVNRMISVIKPEDLKTLPEPVKNIPLLSLKPSREIETTNSCELKNFPFIMRFFLRGIGITNNKGNDLLSYLAFEPNHTQGLLKLGFEDTMARRSEILEFFSGKNQLPHQETTAG